MNDGVESKVLYKITSYDSDFIEDLPDKVRSLDGGTIYYYYDFKKHRYLSKFVSDDFDIYDEIKNQQDKINKAIEYIETHKRKDEFLELNEWGTRDLLEILKGGKNEK